MSQTLPPGLRDRVLASAAKARPTPPGAWVRRTVVIALLIALWIGVAVAVIGRRGDWLELPPVYALGTVLSLVAAAFVLSTLGLSRGRAMLGPPVGLQLALALGLPVMLGLWSYVVPAEVASSLVCSTPAEAIARAPRCDLMSLALATPVLGALFWLRRGTQASSPALTGACLGAAAATWAHLVMHAHCPVAHPWHVVLGHALPLVPLMIVGALAGRRLFR